MKKFLIKPNLVGDLAHAHAVSASHYGPIVLTVPVVGHRHGGHAEFLGAPGQILGADHAARKSRTLTQCLYGLGLEMVPNEFYPGSGSRKACRSVEWSALLARLSGCESKRSSNPGWSSLALPDPGLWAVILSGSGSVAFRFANH
jgi:hypothetical protein